MNKKKIIIISIVAVIVVAASLVACYFALNKNNLKSFISTDESYNYETVYNKKDDIFNIYTFDDDVKNDVLNNKDFIKITNNNIKQVNGVFDSYLKDIKNISELYESVIFRFDPDITVKVDDYYLVKNHSNDSYTILYYDSYLETLFEFGHIK